MYPHIIVSGLGSTGYRIFRLLQQQGAEVVGIHHDHDLPHQDNLVIGDLKDPQVLVKAGIKSAQTLVLASKDDALNVAILTQARLLNPRIRIVNRLYNFTLGERLDQTLPDHVSLSVSSLAAPIFAFVALGNEAIGQLYILGKTWPIHQEVIDRNHPWCGLKLSQLWENPERMLIYYLPSGEEIDLVSAVTSGKTLEEGDHLIVGTLPQAERKRAFTMPKILKALFNIRTYQREGKPVLIVILVLLITIILATLVYVVNNFETSVVDALYFSVGMITGAGGQEEIGEQAPEILKVFTAMMMIVGAGVIGICYALINDFILGSRLRQTWDVARIPTKNHHVLCGLGDVGMQTLLQLHEQGHEVVVIEPDPQNRFLHTARSLGVPIIISDASLATTLEMANVAKAKALIAVVSNDMANVEIALTAKAIAPHLRIVVRCQENQFAQSIKTIFEFDAVLSPTDLATYSFAAAALGGKILGNGMTDDLLWVAIATMITPKHPFAGKTVEQAAKDANGVPLYLTSGGKIINGWPLLSQTLHEGDVLYLTMPATGLHQLWRLDSGNPELLFT